LLGRAHVAALHEEPIPGRGTRRPGPQAAWCCCCHVMHTSWCASPQMVGIIGGHSVGSMTQLLHARRWMEPCSRQLAVGCGGSRQWRQRGAARKLASTTACWAPVAQGGHDLMLTGEEARGTSSGGGRRRVARGSSGALSRVALMSGCRGPDRCEWEHGAGGRTLARSPCWSCSLTPRPVAGDLDAGPVALHLASRPPPPPAPPEGCNGGSTSRGRGHHHHHPCAHVFWADVRWQELA
jgi:hypothetical protein